jgi:hypothetical protein
MKITVYPHPILDQSMIRVIEADTIDDAMTVVTDENAHSGSSILRLDHMVMMDVADCGTNAPTGEDWRRAEKEFADTSEDMRG